MSSSMCENFSIIKSMPLIYFNSSKKVIMVKILLIIQISLVILRTSSNLHALSNCFNSLQMTKWIYLAIAAVPPCKICLIMHGG